MKIWIWITIFCIGMILMVQNNKKTSPPANPYTGGAEAVMRTVGQVIQQETAGGMESVGALDAPRDPIDIAPSPAGTPPNSGTTTTQPNFPAWVKREELSADKYCWHASPHGAPKTPTWAKWGLRPTIDGKGVVALTLPGGKNYRVIFMPGEKTMLQEGGKDPRCPNTAELVSIFADATEVGFEPYNGEPLSARITFSTKE